MNILSIPASARTISGAARRSWIPGARNGLIIAAVAALVLALIVVAVQGESDATLPVDVRPVSTGDPFGLGATTVATVELHNRGHREIAPRFSVSWIPYPYYWRILSGPVILEPGQSATYMIQAPDSVSAPHDGERFQIKVNDTRGITYAISAPIEKKKRDLPIVNPSLSMWTQRDPATALISPAGWNMYERRDSDDRTTIEESDVFGIHAAHFHVVQSGSPDPGLWAHTGLTQDIPFPDQPFDIRVLSRTPYEAISGGWLLTAFGIEVRDGKRGMIWLLFQPTGNGDREYDLPNGNHIRVYDVPLNQWAARTIDLAALYRQLHRRVPERITLKLFIGASSSEPNEVDGYIASIDLHSPAFAGGEIK